MYVLFKVLSRSICSDVQLEIDSQSWSPRHEFRQWADNPNGLHEKNRVLQKSTKQELSQIKGDNQELKRGKISTQPQTLIVSLSY